MKVYKYGEQVLREKATPVAVVDDNLRKLAEDMIETMHAAKGVGLAAEQVGHLEKMCVIDIPEGVKHWHGAQKDSWFQHIATHVAVENSKPGSEPNEWLEPVTDEEYNKLQAK